MNESKKIEPTDAMVEEALFQRPITPDTTRAILRIALNHPDAPGLFADEDDRPWEPLNEGDPLRAGDEVRRVRRGLTITAVVGHSDEDGDPWTAEGNLIGLRRNGTWY